MDINRIRYFLSLAKTGSITQAAELHHISAAAFSKAMRVFSEEMGQQLLVPHGRGILLTDNARALVPALGEVLEKLDALRENPPSTKGDFESKTISVATFEVFSTHFFERALSTVFGDYACSLYEMIPGEMESAVARHTADLALTYIPIPHPDLDFLKIAPVQMGIYGHKDLERPRDFRELAFAVPVTPVVGSPNKVRGLDGWPDDAFPRNIRYRVQMMESALGLCRRKKAVAYLPKFVARLHNETVKPSYALQEFELPPRFTKQRDFIYLVKRKSDSEGVEAKRLATAVRQFCAEATNN